MLERNEIDSKYKWDLSAIYADEDAFMKDYAKAEKMIKAFAAHEKTMTRSAADFFKAYADMTDIENMINQKRLHVWS